MSPSEAICAALAVALGAPFGAGLTWALRMLGRRVRERRLRAYASRWTLDYVREGERERRLLAARCADRGAGPAYRRGA